MSTREPNGADATSQPTPSRAWPSVGDYLALLKPRVMSLVVFTALVGLVAGAGARSIRCIGFIALLCIAVGAGASGALNMWYDADIDARDDAHRGRPIPPAASRPARRWPSA